MRMGLGGELWVDSRLHLGLLLRRDQNRCSADLLSHHSCELAPQLMSVIFLRSFDVKSDLYKWRFAGFAAACSYLRLF